MVSESKEEGCKVRGERTPSRVPGALPTSKASSVRPGTEAPPQRGDVQRGIANADKKARTGSEQEPVRNTPPAGDWNDVA